MRRRVVVGVADVMQKGMRRVRRVVRTECSGRWGRTWRRRALRRIVRVYGIGGTRTQQKSCRKMA